MATEKKAADADGDQKKSKGKLIVLIVLLLLVLGGAGGGWYWWTHIKNAQSASDEGHGKKKQDEKQHPVFVTLDAFTVNLQGEDGRLLQTVIALQMADEEDSAKLKKYMPMVRSRLLLLLSSKKAEDILTEAGKTKLAKEIADQVKQPFFQGDYSLEIQNVLFMSFIVQ
ncbi:MAG: flagellar basal body-associated protein FliL [Burkholderiaceae bacterium]|nr:flagellar basal body-associated protein FliL [Burkholderiaceae bacterium]